MLSLSPRLKKVAEYAGTGNSVADIGTDHAKIPVYLVKNSLFNRAFAADVAEGPLCRAKKYIMTNNCEDKVETVLSDGLDDVPQADVVIIAGMGGELIAEIIRRSIKTAKFDESVFVLQPMTAVQFLRNFLYQNGFEIICEEIVSEKKCEKLYCVIKTKKTSKNIIYTEKDTIVSPVFFEKETPEKKLYLTRLLSQNEEILSSLKKAFKPDENLICQTERTINFLKELIKEDFYENTSNL